jgi:hypothetical protein
MKRVHLASAAAAVLAVLSCLFLAGCPGGVEICKNQVKVSDIKNCTGSVVTVIIEQGTGRQRLGGQVNKDSLTLPAEVTDDGIAIGEGRALVFSTTETMTITITFSGVPANCPVAGKTFKFTGKLKDFRKGEDCFSLPLARFKEQ